eukprot:jgi/Chrzof1/2400/Cz11g14010.t1
MPTIGICRAQQRQKACQKLGINYADLTPGGELLSRRNTTSCQSETDITSMLDMYPVPVCMAAQGQQEQDFEPRVRQDSSPYRSQSSGSEQFTAVSQACLEELSPQANAVDIVMLQPGDVAGETGSYPGTAGLASSKFEQPITNYPSVMLQQPPETCLPAITSAATLGHQPASYQSLLHATGSVIMDQASGSQPASVTLNDQRLLLAGHCAGDDTLLHEQPGVQHKGPDTAVQTLQMIRSHQTGAAAASQQLNNTCQHSNGSPRQQPEPCLQISSDVTAQGFVPAIATASGHTYHADDAMPAYAATHGISRMTVRDVILQRYAALDFKSTAYLYGSAGKR